MTPNRQVLLGPIVPPCSSCLRACNRATPHRRTKPRSCDLVRSSLLRLAEAKAKATALQLLCSRGPAPSLQHPAGLQLHVRHPRARTRSACRLCCSTLNFQPVFGPPTPRPYRRLACRALLLGRRPRKPQAGCAPALPADAAGAPRLNVSTMVSAPSAGHVSTEAKTANIRLLPRSDRGGVRAVSLQNRNSRRTRTGGPSSARVYKASMELRLDWDLWKALVQCWTRSIPAC